MADYFGFRAVGQGLFYTGSLLDGNYNFVYDCGTDNSQSYIRREVARFNTVCHKKELEFVVISHLHHDHYSGLQELMNNFTVKQIFLPYLGSLNLTELVLANSTFGRRRIAATNFEEDRALFRFMWGLYFEDSDIMRAERIFLGRENNDSEPDSEFIHTFRYFNFKKEGMPYWEFHFLNKTYNSKIMKNFEDKVDNLIKNYGVRSIRELIDDGQIGLIKRMYEEVFGRGNYLNLTSTVLVHFPTELNKCFLLRRRPYWRLCGSECFHTNRAITLLTGDAEMDSNEIAQLNSILTGGSGILQVPHHGSYPNWTSLGNIRNYFNAMVIPVGRNGHGLPSPRTVHEIQSRNVSLHYADQNHGCHYTII